MIKFTEKLETAENQGFYKIKVEVELIIKAENTGEAGYKSDSILSSVDDMFVYSILDISETDERIDPSLISESLDIIDIESKYKEKFGDISPNKQDEMDWYSDMRTLGYDGIEIFKFLDQLKNKDE